MCQRLLRLRGEGGIYLGAAQEGKRHFQCGIVFWLSGHIGLRAHLFLSLRSEVSWKIRFTDHHLTRLEILGYLLQNFDIRCDALSLYRSARRREVPRRRQAERAIRGL